MRVPTGSLRHRTGESERTPAAAQGVFSLQPHQEYEGEGTDRQGAVFAPLASTLHYEFSGSQVWRDVDVARELTLTKPAWLISLEEEEEESEKERRQKNLPSTGRRWTASRARRLVRTARSTSSSASTQRR